MKKILFLFLLLIPISVFSQEKIIMAEVEWDRGTVKLNNVYFSEGYERQEKHFGTSSLMYSLKMVSEEGEILAEKEFRFFLDLSVDGNRDEDVFNSVLDRQVQLVSLPFTENAEMLLLFDVNKNYVQKKDISYLFYFCGNGICQNQEDHSTCPADCLESEKDGYCSPGLGNSDPDCARNIEAEKQIKSETGSSKHANKQTYLIFGILLCLSAGLLFLAYFFLVKNKKIEDD